MVLFLHIKIFEYKFFKFFSTTPNQYSFFFFNLHWNQVRINTYTFSLVERLRLVMRLNWVESKKKESEKKKKRLSILIQFFKGEISVFESWLIESPMLNIILRCFAYKPFQIRLIYINLMISTRRGQWELIIRNK